MALELGLVGKTAIVTGGSAGIGLAIAKALYGEGVNVAIASRSQERLDRAIHELQALPNQGNRTIAIQADLTQAEAIEQVVYTTRSTFGTIDILINNAGSAGYGSFLELDERVFLDAWNLKLLGYIRLVKAVVPGLIEQRDGRIINIVGSAGRTPPPRSLAGGSTNAALLNFTRGIASELAQHNIRINAISPGATATERFEHSTEQTAIARGISPEAVKAQTLAAIPLGRVVEPQEIANLALFLVSDLAASITGTEILVDGGRTPGV